MTPSSGDVVARIFIEAYGCAASYGDSEMIAGMLANGGHTLVTDSSESDLNIVVTCSVKDATANRMIRRIKSLNSRPLVVAGCLPKAEPGTVQKFAKNASMLGPNSIGRVLHVVDSALAGGRLAELSDTDASKTGLPKVRLNPVVGIVEIASGCLSECTFCQTKLAKADLKSYRLGDIVRQVQAEVNDGCREIWLTSTDNGCYGLDIGTSLPELLREVCDIPSEFRVRVGMMNPMYMPRIRDGLLDAYENPKLYRFLHVPVQSGSDRVLHEMRRGHTAGTFSNVAGLARRRFGDFTISTDVIVGFPTETDSDFEDTVAMLERVRPDVVNLSRYSARPGTESATWRQIDESETRRRSRTIFELANKISLENNRRWLGWTGDVLFNEQTPDGVKGRNFAYKPVFVRDEVEVGQTCTVQIHRATINSLVGHITS